MNETGVNQGFDPTKQPDGTGVYHADSKEKQKTEREKEKEKIADLEKKLSDKEKEIKQMVATSRESQQDYEKFLSDQYAIEDSGDIEEYRAQLADLKKSVEYDEKTGLMLGTRFHAEVKKVLLSISREQRSHPNLGAVVTIDMNGLKFIDDEGGHSEGDRILTEFANVILESVRRGDFASRKYSTGDEFRIFLRNADYRTGGLEIAKRMIENAKKRGLTVSTLNHGTIEVDLSFAMGVEGLKHDSSVDELIGKADRAERIAKQSMGSDHSKSVLALTDVENPERYDIINEDQILAYQEQKRSD